MEEQTKTRAHTHLASLYYVLSVLHRQQINAEYKKEGKKERIEIIFADGPENKITIDVHGNASGNSKWIGIPTKSDKINHFIAFVAFGNEMKIMRATPEVFIVPANELGRVMAKGKNKRVKYKGNKELFAYKDNWGWEIIKKRLKTKKIA